MLTVLFLEYALLYRFLNLHSCVDFAEASDCVALVPTRHLRIWYRISTVQLLRAFRSYLLSLSSC